MAIATLPVKMIATVSAEAIAAEEAMQLPGPEAHQAETIWWLPRPEAKLQSSREAASQLLQVAAELVQEPQTLLTRRTCWQRCSARQQSTRKQQRRL